MRLQDMVRRWDRTLEGQETPNNNAIRAHLSSLIRELDWRDSWIRAGYIGYGLCGCRTFEQHLLWLALEEM